MKLHLTDNEIEQLLSVARDISIKSKLEWVKHEREVIREVAKKLKCAISGDQIKILEEDLWEPSTIEDLETWLYDDAVVGIIYAGYGSDYDGSTFILALKDDEIAKLIKDGKIIKVP